jgi:hypothetical protein
MDDIPSGPCRIQWFVYAGTERIRHTAQMRGTWGYDAVCVTHGWDSRTGGALRRYVADEVWHHKRDHQPTNEGTDLP